MIIKILCAQKAYAIFNFSINDFFTTEETIDVKIESLIT